ncbi:hypothetical protein [Mycetocola zhadangensis]|uniref:Glutaminase n=1 Tax=Mycetocola zhadangensis TaxID=1164595 RepID=A0A3L7J682_9MICO|nr:hypothetical protein [Mycetocola zhadangensis]RLQ85969.1 hypothetical protein D9V28_03745 [Mycetocola zhadangensis]GGE87291.1 hypothetical protein GCM10011313_07330 [Mycetocola zhadangensis]
MTEHEDDANLADGIRSSLRSTRDRLETAGARDEALATFVPAHRGRLFAKKATMVPQGRVWRLGVLLLDHDAQLYETGLTARALEPGRPAYQSVSAEQRREYRAAAFRGKFTRGETVNFDAAPIELDADALRVSTGALFLRNDRVLVRWSPTASDEAAVDLDDYLTDRAGLLLDPPEGA